MAAGQRATNKTEAAAIESGILSFRFTPAAVAEHGLFIAERKMAIENVTVRYKTNAGSALVGQLAYVPSGTAMSGTNFDITDTGNVDFNTTAATNYTPSFHTTAGRPDQNVVPEGALVFLELGSGTVGALADVVITIRYSTVIR